MSLSTSPTIAFASSPPAISEILQKEINPEDLHSHSLALKNRWPKHELYYLLAPIVSIFVCGSLTLPWVLARVQGPHRRVDGVEETASYVTRTTLRKHSRVPIIADRLPTFVRTKKKAAVGGMLIAELTSVATARMGNYIGNAQHENTEEWRRTWK